MTKDQLHELSKYAFGIDARSYKGNTVKRHIDFINIGFGDHLDASKLLGRDLEEEFEKEKILWIIMAEFNYVEKGYSSWSKPSLNNQNVLTYHVDPILAAQDMIDWLKANSTGKLVETLDLDTPRSISNRADGMFAINNPLRK